MVMFKGVSFVCVVLCYVLLNVIGLIVNVIVLSLLYLFGGVIVVEMIFNYLGFVSLMVDVVGNCDFLLV